MKRTGFRPAGKRRPPQPSSTGISGSPRDWCGERCTTATLTRSAGWQDTPGSSHRSTISSASLATCSQATPQCSPPARSRRWPRGEPGRSGDIRGLGWRLAPEGWGAWPEDTLWHTGFTGTSLLVSRPLGLGVVLLTNAIHPRRRIEDQAEMRAAIHRRVSEAFT